MSNTKTPPKTPKKTKAERDLERLNARTELQQHVNRVPQSFSLWGVVRTRAWVALHKKAVSALGSKRGPSVKRCQQLLAKFGEINSASLDLLTKQD